MIDSGPKDIDGQQCWTARTRPSGHQRAAAGRRGPDDGWRSP